MAGCACYYNVLIASSSDAQAERRRVFDAISEWNGKARRQILFIPLMWEKHAIADADSNGPQDAINQQLLARSDYVIAIFRSRIGTPTQDYPGGTIEELARRNGKAAVFFCHPTPPIDTNVPDVQEQFEQFNRLRAFKERFNSANGGLSRLYSDPEDLAQKVRDQLDGWAVPAMEHPTALLASYPMPWNFETLARPIADSSQRHCLLFYNTELNGFKDFTTFKQTWSFLLGERNDTIGKVVFLLFDYKLNRLRKYLLAIRDEVTKNFPGLLDRFQVCQILENASTTPSRACSSLAFAMVRCGSDPAEGEYLPLAHLVPLCQPFSWAPGYTTGESDIIWEYQYFLESSDRMLCSELQDIWREYYKPDKAVSLTDFVGTPTSPTAADDGILDRQKRADGPNTHQDTTALTLITQLKEKLFDPNVPSYLLNDQFEMLDWNAAFELIFPTDRFYRNESAKEFVEVLDNKDEVKKEAKRIIRESTGDGSELLLEPLKYTSPVYGSMAFTKIASRVEFKNTCGWIVALNINHVEHRGQYEADLRTVNREQALISAYAQGFDRFQAGFPGLSALLQVYVRHLRDCAKILDLGAGPGLLTHALLLQNKSVTAVEPNDAMLQALRRRCGALPGLSILKANVDSLHAPNPFYDNGKIGIHPPYDGVCIHNLYFWLNDPAEFLKRLLTEDIIRPGATVTLALATPRSEVENYFGALNRFRAKSPENGTSAGFSQYLKAVDDLIDLDIIGKYTEDDVEQHFTSAGYRVKKEFAGYQVGGKDYKGFPFFAAKAP